MDKQPLLEESKTPSDHINEINKATDNDELIFDANEQIQIPDFGDLIDSTLSKLDTLQKLKILMTFMNYFTKVWALYLVIVEYEMFSKNSLLLFSYILYAFLEVVAVAAAVSIILLAKVGRVIFQLPTYYLDQFGCIPILYSIFRFCFIVTFFVQSVTLMLFSNFSDWQYPLLLAFSLLCLIALQFFRIVMMCSSQLRSTCSFFDFDGIIGYIAPSSSQNAYKILRVVISEAYEFYTNLDPHVKLRIKQINKVRVKAMELRENLDWVKNKMGYTQGQGQGESLVIKQQSGLSDIIEANESAENSRITQLHK